MGRKWLRRIGVAAVVTLLAAGCGYCSARAVDIPLESEVYEYLEEQCELREVPVSLALAMIETESGFDPSAVSKTNDYGLMQINKINHKWLKKHFGTGWDPLDAKDNLRAGLYILAGYLQKYEDTHQALMAYNCGEAGARRLWKKGYNTSTYSRKIVDRMEVWADTLKEKEQNAVKWTAEQIEELRRLCNDEVSNADIATLLGRPLKDIYAARSALGITIAKVKAAKEARLA